MLFELSLPPVCRRGGKTREEVPPGRCQRKTSQAPLLSAWSTHSERRERDRSKETAAQTNVFCTEMIDVFLALLAVSWESCEVSSALCASSYPSTQQLSFRATIAPCNCLECTLFFCARNHYKRRRRKSSSTSVDRYVVLLKSVPLLSARR